MTENLIGPRELQEALAGAVPPVVLDVRWRLDKPEGLDDFAQGHIPSATYVSLDRELSDLTKPGLGRHPLPRPADVEKLLHRLGVTAGKEIVIYDDWNRSGSSRAWWVLTASGIDNVRILDGGYAGWVGAGGEVESGTVQATASGQPEEVRLPDLYAAALSPVLDATQAAHVARAGLLLDARHHDRYSGRANPPGETPGHIPGAANLAGTSLLDENGFFKPAEQLRDIFDRAGVTAAVSEEETVGAYCGSGITACVVIAAAHSIGRDVALFPGSWSQWQEDPANPVECG